MQLAPGSELGPYKIAALIGKGGMGEVYRAHDSRLGRDVAIKVAAEEFTERFTREARAIAALNHTNTCHLYDVGPNYLVLEFVEGETLQGPMSFEDALPIIKQLIDGIEAAHERNIIHRDLKPANIKVTPDGVVKILDFGLAKAMDSTGPDGPASNPSVTNSPTIATLGMTRQGMIVGTSAYMAPEQAKGKPADKRSDIWAFGVVVYELLTGKPLFAGETAVEILGAVLNKDADVSAAPARAHKLLRWCLEKDRKDRLHSVSDARRLLAEEPPSTTAAVDKRSGWIRTLPWVAAAVMSGAAAALLPSALTHWRESPPARVLTRFEFSPPVGVSLNLLAVPWVSASPDGRYIAFSAQSAEGFRLWIRSLDDVTVKALPGTENAQTPFWSPDSSAVAFVAGGVLKKINLAGNSLQTIAPLPADFITGSAPLGGTWSSSGTILLGASNQLNTAAAGGLWQVAGSGGPVMPLALAKRENAVDWRAYPVFLPDGRRFLFTQFVPGSARRSVLYLGSLDSSDVTQLGEDFGQLQLASGSLFFTRGRSLMVQPFDTGSGRLTGDPALVLDDLFTSDINGRASYAVSNGGMLVYFNGEGGISQFTWVNRGGQAASNVGTAAQHQTMHLSADGTRLTFSSRNENGTSRNLWVIDLTRNVTTKLTFGDNRDSDGVWSPDGTRIAFSSIRQDGKSIYEMPASGGPDRLLMKDNGRQLNPDAWSPDGRFLVYHTQFPGEFWVLPMTGNEKPFLLVKPASGRVDEPSFSPDGKWLAYNSNESGRDEVYVVPFPPTGARSQVSSEGGMQAQWRRDGRELFFLNPQGAMMAVDVKPGASLELGKPRELFQTRLAPAGAVDQYVSLDGQRFLIMNPVGDAATTPLTVILDWPALLVRK